MSGKYEIYPAPMQHYLLRAGIYCGLLPAQDEPRRRGPASGGYRATTTPTPSGP
jgi:hypothetical protein